MAAITDKKPILAYLAIVIIAMVVTAGYGTIQRNEITNKFERITKCEGKKDCVAFLERLLDNATKEQLARLRGPRGLTGPRGAPGSRGSQGSPGAPGPAGAPGLSGTTIQRISTTRRLQPIQIIRQVPQAPAPAPSPPLPPGKKAPGQKKKDQPQAQVPQQLRIQLAPDAPGVPIPPAGKVKKPKKG